MDKVIAFPSLPAIKVGGMRNRERRIPLHGSVRFAVTGQAGTIYTSTEAALHPDGSNILYINKNLETGKPLARVEQIYNRLCELAAVEGYTFRIDSENVGYPTGGGLASSAAGSAAACLALYKRLQEIKPEFELSEADLTRVARLASSTAVGSVVGSYAELKVTDDDAWGERIAEPGALPDLRIAVALVKGGEESDKIHAAMERSRYREARLAFVRDKLPEVRRAIADGDTARFIRCVHEDTLSFHGAALEKGIMTFEAETLPILRRVQDMVNAGRAVGCSIAGGPTPIILATSDEQEYVLSQLSDVMGEAQLIKCQIADRPRYD
jgi:mevalonate pyrophosphate decarboxylase